MILEYFYLTKKYSLSSKFYNYLAMAKELFTIDQIFGMPQ